MAGADPEILRRTAIFRSLDETDFEALVMCLRVREIQADEVLFREGEPGQSMMIVGEGTLVATVRRTDGGEQETVFNTCVNGGGAPDASCICSAGVGVGDMTTTCSRKTTCGALEYTQVCQKLEDGEPWTCSCFANGGLLGTCAEQDEFEHCSNQYGCCVPLFCAAGQE